MVEELEVDSKRDANSTPRGENDTVRALKRELAAATASGNTGRAERIAGRLARAGVDPIERAVSDAPETAEPVKKRASRPGPKAKGQA